MKRLTFILLLLVPAISGAGERPTVKAWRGIKDPLPKRGNYAIPTGFIFPAILDGAIFSFNLLTPVVAVTEDPVSYQGEIVFPKGTQFIGNVQVLHSLDRVNIDFHTCVFPDGQEIRVHFLAMEMDGSAGVKGKVEKHKDAVAAKIAMKSVLSGVQMASVAGVPTVEGGMAAGLSQEAMSAIDVPTPKTIESISVEERTPIKVFNRERVEF